MSKNTHTHIHGNLKITEQKENINEENMIQSDRNMNEYKIMIV